MPRDRSYIGEVSYRRQWHPGSHEPIIERDTWTRVQRLLGGKVYRAYELTCAGQLIRCAHGGHYITGEHVRKKTKTGENWHIYYRCSRYRTKDHPQVRLREAQLDEQILASFASIRIDDQELREWFAMMLRSQTRDSQEQAKEQREELQRQLTKVLEQQDRILNLRILDEISADDFEVGSVGATVGCAKIAWREQVFDRLATRMNVERGRLVNRRLRPM